VVDMEGTSSSAVKLTRGSVVFASTRDMHIHTTFGAIDIDAGSVVLILSGADSVSVYNMDDLHHDSVVVRLANQSVSLAPGMTVTVTSGRVKHFDDINPAQLVMYRGVAERTLDSGLRMFTAEFSLPSAISAVLPFKSLISSKHPEARHLANHLLK